ncbi:MAG: right-handed parallel beta-helix repeat-containing protein [Planctomycetota bacterium]|jgi:hypothetical protein
MSVLKYSVIISAFFFISTLGFSATIHVPGDEPTIMDGIQAAQTGDTVLVAPGTYVENLNYHGKAVHVKSSDGPEVTVIDGNQNEIISVIWFNGNEGPNSVIDGFTITNGKPWKGGGIYVYHASPTIINNIIKDNWAHVGGGIYCENGSPLILNNQIEYNRGDHIAGIYLEDSSPIIYRNTIQHNLGDVGGGICCRGVTSPEITKNTIRYNYADKGGGIYFHRSLATVNNNIITGNSADIGGGLFCILNSHVTAFNNTVCGNAADSGAGLYIDGSDPDFTNTIFWDNSSKVGSQIDIISGHPTITYCDVMGGLSGPGNFEEDPLFVDSANDNYHLTWTSPCINRGSNDGAPLEDIDDDDMPYMGIVDVGADEYANVLPLEADAFIVTEASGGTINFAIRGGQENAGRKYLVLGSVTGTIPGTALPGGSATLRINWDPYTDLVLILLNSMFFTSFYGTLNGSGVGAAQLNAPSLHGFVGLQMHYAFCLSSPFDFVSNPVVVDVVP